MAGNGGLRTNRRDLLPRPSGTGLTGMVLLGMAGCGGRRQHLQLRAGVGLGLAGPHNAADGESPRVTRQIFDGLLDFAPESTDVMPVLATESPRTAVGPHFKLGEGAKSKDGASFDAEAVEFTFDRWRDSKNPYRKSGGRQSGNFAYYVGQFGGLDDDSV